jgi:uridine phosphorylase
VPSRLRPTAPTAAAAILVGDPGRALLLAQELLIEPKMSNHARGLWGYYGKTSAGEALTVQSTGMGGPSAALVLGDLAELGVARAVRVGTCVSLDPTYALGDLLLVGEAVAKGGSATSLGIEVGATVTPDSTLTERLRRELGGERGPVAVASLDTHPAEPATTAGIGAADMQTAPLLAQASNLGIEAAALLIVAEKGSDRGRLGEEKLGELEKRAGRAASRVLSG